MTFTHDFSYLNLYDSNGRTQYFSTSESCFVLFQENTNMYSKDDEVMRSSWINLHFLRASPALVISSQLWKLVQTFPHCVQGRLQFWSIFDLWFLWAQPNHASPAAQSIASHDQSLQSIIKIKQKHDKYLWSIKIKQKHDQSF